MKGYESVIIVDPNLTEEDQKALLAKMTGLFTSNGGTVVNQATWGRRKLAYPVKKRDYGIYHLFYLDNTPAALKAMETQFRYEDNIIKWQTVAVEDVQSEIDKFDKLKTSGSVYPQVSER
jgi:small subunit ribosomal protein S6